MLQMLELGARYENGKYVGRWREYDNTEDSEEETDDEDETAFWAYESRSTDTTRLLNGEVGGLVLLSLHNMALWSFCACILSFHSRETHFAFPV
jgi:hypothetical protein